MARERPTAAEVEQHPQESVDDQEAEVLREAAGALSEWAEQLPEGSPWRSAFETVGGELRACLGSRAVARRERVA